MISELENIAQDISKVIAFLIMIDPALASNAFVQDMQKVLQWIESLPSNSTLNESALIHHS